jgi:hypothetical protein
MSIMQDGRHAFVFCIILQFVNVVLKETFCFRSWCSVTVGCTFQTCRKVVLVREGFVWLRNCAATAAVKDLEMGCLSARTFDNQLLWE